MVTASKVRIKVTFGVILCSLFRYLFKIFENYGTIIRQV